MDRFDAMRTLLAAVDGGSLSAASRALRMPLPTVSRKVSELEAHLGTQVLIRTSRKLLLTDAGAIFVAAIRRILEDLDNAERVASGEYQAPRGNLLITTSIMFGKLHLMPIVVDFLKAQPEITTRLVLADHIVDLIENHVDVAVRIGQLPDSSMISTTVGKIHWTVCASPEYVARQGIPHTPSDLGNHHCIAFEGLQPNRTWTFGPDARTITIKPYFSVSTADAVIDAAIAGVGIARLTSYQCSAAIRAGKLIPVLREYTPDHIPVQLVHPTQPLVPLKVRAFMDYTAPRLRAALTAIDI